MLRRVPVVATLVVLTAVGLMVWLGFWQLDRLQQKQVMIADFAKNIDQPELSVIPLVGNQFMFRKARIQCDYTGSFQIEGAGRNGYRVLGMCRDVGLVQLGTTRDPRPVVQWGGGEVSGQIVPRPDHRPLIQTAFDPADPYLMLVADPALAGLAPNARPDPSSVPNNHLSYAVQWFLFALTALVIYALALRKRLAARGDAG